jgi:hypothetical protein
LERIAWQCLGAGHQISFGGRLLFEARNPLGSEANLVTLAKITVVLVRLDHVASFIVNANHGIM